MSDFLSLLITMWQTEESFLHVFLSWTQEVDHGAVQLVTFEAHVFCSGEASAPTS
jgi:hypothetical protein